MPQGKRTPVEISQKVRELLIENEKLVGKELKAEVEKDPAFAKLNITERTYQAIRKKELPIVKMVKTSIPENIWSIGTLANTNDITPEAVPHIIDMQKWASMQKESLTERPFPPVTVRQAKWVSRILPLFLTRISGDITESNFELSNVKLGWLWRWSIVYSINERLYELTGKKEKQEVFDTSELDAALLRGDRIDVFGDTYVRFSGDKISGGKDKAISVITSDESIIKRSVKESIFEESAQTLKELPKFKKVMKERGKNE